MPRWTAPLLGASSFAIRWVGRLYGAFFLALGVLFLYWSGRGLLAYTAGTRAAWSDPLACIAGLIAASLSLWAGVGLIRKGIPPSRIGRLGGMSEELETTLEEAMRLEQTDPVASRQLLDDYFRRDAAATEARRAELRDRARYDLNAALALRRELQTEVADNELVRKDMLASVPEGQRTPMLTQIDDADQQLQAELAQLDGTIERLKLQ